MGGDRPLWPRWARNLFVLQLLLNLVAMVAFPVLHFSGQSRDHILRSGAEEKIAECKANLEKLRERVEGQEKEMRDWWSIDTRNLRDSVRADVEALFKQHTEQEH